MLRFPDVELLWMPLCWVSHWCDHFVCWHEYRACTCPQHVM